MQDFILECFVDLLAQAATSGCLEEVYELLFDSSN